MGSKAKILYRKKTRELLFRIIFQMTISGDFTEKAKDAFLADTSLYIGDVDENIPIGCIFDRERGETPDLNYLNFAFLCVSDNIGDIDKILAGASEKWSIGRMSNTDLAILRLAAAEILYIDTIDDATSIAEAVVMAKKYGTENSPAFVNGILGTVARSKTGDEPVKTVGGSS